MTKTVYSKGEDLKYEVEDILEVHKIHHRFKYLVSWHGYGPEENTWEPLSNLDNAINTVLEFHRCFPQKPWPGMIADRLA